MIVSRNIEVKVHQRAPDYLDDHRKMVRLLAAGKSIVLQELVTEHIKADWNYFKICAESSEREHRDDGGLTVERVDSSTALYDPGRM